MLSTFVFSFALLTFLRLTRSQTWLAFALSAFLSVVAVAFSFSHFPWIERPAVEPRHVFAWLSAAAWVTTFWGSREPVWTIFLLPSLFSNSGLIGIFTGIALNLPLPRRKPKPEKENFGIYRHT